MTTERSRGSFTTPAVLPPEGPVNEIVDQRLARVRADAVEGARRLAEKLTPLDSVLAYPYGEYDVATEALISELGMVAFGQRLGAVGPSSEPKAAGSSGVPICRTPRGEAAVPIAVGGRRRHAAVLRRDTEGGSA